MKKLKVIVFFEVLKPVVGFLNPHNLTRVFKHPLNTKG